MDKLKIKNIQKKIFPDISENFFYNSLHETQNSFYSLNTLSRTLLLEMLSSPNMPPIFCPLSQDEICYIITKSSLDVIDSENNNALLIALDKEVIPEFIPFLVSKSNISHKNSEGVNAFTFCILKQHLLPFSIIAEVYNNCNEPFSKTIKNISSSFYKNNDLTPDILYAKFQSFKKIKNKSEIVKKIAPTIKNSFRN